MTVLVPSTYLTDKPLGKSRVLLRTSFVLCKSSSLQSIPFPFSREQHVTYYYVYLYVNLVL